MPMHSQRNTAFSEGDAAILIRAMNRQRGEATRSVELTDVSLPRSRRATSPAHASRTVPGEGGMRVVGRPGTDPALRLAGREASEDRPVRSGRPGGRRARTSTSDGVSRRERDATSTSASGPLQVLASRFSGITPRTRRAMAIAACVVALVAFFYGPVADLYAASRDHEQLVAKVEAMNAVADDLKSEVDRLQTEEGVMDEARIRGYAAPGEVAVDASELLGIEDTVTVPELSKPIKTEEPPLYIQILDVIMGYEEHV